MNTKFVPKITHPCSQDWSKMAGDEKKRFCEQCQLHVHNLAAMSAEEREGLLAKRGERRCVTYVTNERSIQVQTGTWLMLQRLLRSWRSGLAFASVVLAFVTTGCATTTRRPPAPPVVSSEPCHEGNRTDGKDFKQLMGGIPVWPLWHRILFFWR